MALEGPFTLDDLVVMTGGVKKSAHRKLEWLARMSVQRTRKDAPAVARLIGIDPGTRFVGWGVVDCEMRSRTMTLVDCGCIAPGVKLPLKDRLRGIFEELETIIARTKPRYAALEETFAGENMKSAIAMGEGRGIALLALTRAGLEVLELSPRSIKQAVTGSGAATKARVATMVAARLGLKSAPEPEDVTDALAAAIALSQNI